MSIVSTQPAAYKSTPTLHRLPTAFPGAPLAAILTPLSLFVLGYHPYAEDGGLYLAGVKYLLNPTLYPHYRAFVTAPLTYSLFAPFMAFFIRHSGLAFEQVIFAFFVFCLFATIFSAGRIARICFPSFLEQAGATLLVALWLGLPVAGTSLMLIDPYLTARSFSTPLVLLALAETLRAVTIRRSSTRAGAKSAFVTAFVCVAVAALFHPLMAGYGAAFILAAIWMESQRPGSTSIRALLLFAAGFACAAAIQILSPMPSTVVTRVCLTRSYWFLGKWEWFEVLGLLAPLLLLLILRSKRVGGFSILSRTAVICGVTAMGISICFARPALLSFGVSHLQPLRIFQLIYFALLIGLGAWLTRFLLHNIWWRWGVAVFLLGAPVVVPAYLVFPSSPHIEWPLGAFSRPNPWVEAFRWSAHNTPNDALFALDANYISLPKEDAQSFRAVAERSSLPDYSKDGGETAVNPLLSEDWARGVDAQTNLSSKSDAARDQALRGFGVTWMVLRSEAVTAMPCFFDNGTVKVCRLDVIAGR